MAEVSNDEANDRADDILGREEFLNSSEPGVFQRAVDRVFEFIGDVLGRIFETIFGGVGGGAGQGFAIVLLILALAVLLFAIYRAISNRPEKDEDEATGARVVFDEIVEPAALRADMDRYVAAGEWRDAVVAGFRLSIVGLIDAKIAREISGATTGDFATAVSRRRPELLTDYEPAARSFERAFYSNLTIDESDMDHVRTLLNRLGTTVGGASK